MNNWQNENQGDFLNDFDEVSTDLNIPDGTHPAWLTGWKVDTNHKGTPFVRFSFEIIEGEGTGSVVSHTVFWTDAAKQHAKKVCQLLGVDPRRSVDDYPAIFAEILTQIRDGAGGPYVEAKAVRRLSDVPVASPPADSPPAPGGFPGEI